MAFALRSLFPLLGIGFLVVLARETRFSKRLAAFRKNPRQWPPFEPPDARTRSV